jgi:hypothetical protein
MAFTTYASGTQTAVIGTEHFLSSPNVAGVFSLVVDKSAMVAGDYLELRCYQMVLTGGTSRVAYKIAYPDAQSADDMIAISIPIINDLTDTNSVRFSLTQTQGTGRAFPWKVRYQT